MSVRFDVAVGLGLVLLIASCGQDKDKTRRRSKKGSEASAGCATLCESAGMRGDANERCAARCEEAISAGILSAENVDEPDIGTACAIRCLSPDGSDTATAPPGRHRSRRASCQMNVPRSAPKRRVRGCVETCIERLTAHPPHSEAVAWTLVQGLMKQVAWRRAKATLRRACEVGRR